MRTANPKRVLKLNIKNDVEKASAEAEKVLEKMSKLEGLSRNTLRAMNPVPMNITISGAENIRHSQVMPPSSINSNTISPSPEQQTSLKTTFMR